MTIRKKDGTIFQVRRQNPIMINQDIWDGYTLHNFHEEAKEEITNFKPEEVTHNVATYTPLDEIDPVEIKVPIKNKITAYCLPATNREIADALYGESRTATTFGNQFTFQLVIEDQTDLTLKVWSNIDAMIERNSILYLPIHRRWWSVVSRTEEEKGFSLECMPSNEQPRFT